MTVMKRRHKMTMTAAMAAAVLTVASQTALAAGDDVPVSNVVELFTSQGCSSCPPADKVLQGLAGQDDVIALAYHVDYWDYLGWKDTLGSKANTERQYDYSHSLGTRSVYTPQAVVNGAGHVNGGNKNAIDKLMKTTGPLSTAITVEKSGAGYSISVDDRNAIDSAELRLVCYRDQVIVDIGRGENSGRQIVYVNAVVGSKSLGKWSGNPVDFNLERENGIAKTADGCAVLAQETTDKGAPARIVGAAILPRF